MKAFICSQNRLDSNQLLFDLPLALKLSVCLIVCSMCASSVRSVGMCQLSPIICHLCLCGCCVTLHCYEYIPCLQLMVVFLHGGAGRRANLEWGPREWGT